MAPATGDLLQGTLGILVLKTLLGGRPMHGYAIARWIEATTDDVLLLVAGGDPDAMLFRYTAYGELGGDSWHLTVADAQEQAGEEYGDALLPWEPVPDDITDAHSYAINFAADRLNDRGKW